MRGIIRLAAMAAVGCLLLMAAVPPAVAGDAPRAAQASYWYMAEGSTEGGMQTFILVLNPGFTDAHINVTLNTGTGVLTPPEIQDVTIPPQSRATFHLNAFVTTYDVSTYVWENTGGDIVCERAMYGPGLTWAHASIGAESPLGAWYLAEGSTAGGMETWVLLMNPTGSDVHVDVTLMTGSGAQSPPALQGYVVPPNSRRSINLGDYVTTYDVSTKVYPLDGAVVCERSMYGPGRAWATSSLAQGMPSNEWYLSEGSTAGGMETWVLVQNPQVFDQHVNITLMTESGPQSPAALQDYPVPAGHRVSFNLGDYVTSYDVSTRVTSVENTVIAERAMYGPGRAWAHNSIGAWQDSYIWHLAEGATWGNMETWVLVMNPNPSDAHVNVTLFTNTGPVNPPALQNYPVPAQHRVSFNIAGFLDEADFGVEVFSLDTDIIVERSMYGNGREWGTCTIGSIP